MTGDVHVVMTREALARAGALEDAPADGWEHVRGVLWNDDPEGFADGGNADIGAKVFGARAEGATFGPGDSLFDRFGKGFTLLRLGRRPADTRSLEAAARRRRVPLTTIDLPDADARELYGRDLALIRPDQYVAWRGDTPPADPDRLIERLTGGT